MTVGRVVVNRLQINNNNAYMFIYLSTPIPGWLGSRVVSMLDSGAEGPEFKSQSRPG